MSKLEEIQNIIKNEFGVIEKFFSYESLPFNEAKITSDPKYSKRGVYIIYHPDKGYLKVGKSKTNCKKRSLEHFRDNTGGIIGDYAKINGTMLFYVIIEDDNKDHWLPSLELFLEKTLKPIILSKRLE